MLKVLGTVYSEKTEDFNKIAEALEGAGYQLAYKYSNNAEVIEEVVDEPANPTT